MQSNDYNHINEIIIVVNIVLLYLEFNRKRITFLHSILHLFMQRHEFNCFIHTDALFDSNYSLFLFLSVSYLKCYTLS